MSDRLFGIHGLALQVRSQRMGLLASNIANAATPGYKARDIDFGTALASLEAGEENKRAGEGAMRYRVPVLPGLDGNTVEMATEQAAFAENALHYATSLEFVRGRAETLTRALRGE